VGALCVFRDYELAALLTFVRRMGDAFRAFLFFLGPSELFPAGAVAVFEIAS